MRQGIYLAVVLTMLTFQPAAAQESSSDSMRDLIQELNDIIDRGERDRLADPWYLQDLRAIVSRYANPFGAVIYAEEFQRDGTPPTPWQVLQGEMRVDWRSGLRSVVRAQTQSSSSSGSSSGSTSSGGDVGQQLLGAILRGVTQSQSGNNSSGGSSGNGSGYNDGTTPAIAVAATEITNGFRMEAEISIAPLSESEPPSVELGVYQVQGSVYPGYRLWFDAQDGSVTLLRIGSRGQSVVYSAALNATTMDGRVKRIVWSRLPDGTMSLTVENEEIFSTVDRGFSDPWAGLFLRNSGGDVSLRRISVAAADANVSGGSSWSNPN